MTPDSVRGVAALLDNPLEHSFQLGLVLRSVSSAAMPASLNRKLKSRLTDTQVDILPNYKDWFLCDTVWITLLVTRWSTPHRNTASKLPSQL